jgi:RNA polymerase sigma factor (sigma-70 family)
MSSFDSLPHDKLTTDEEDALARKIQRNKKDTDSIHRLVMHNMREAVIYMRRCSHGLVEDGELISVLYTAMCLSAKRFKPGKVRFFAFSKVRIRGAVKRNWQTLDVVKKAKAMSRGQAHADLRAEKPSKQLPDDEEAQIAPGVPLPPLLDSDPLDDSEVVQPEFDRVTMNERWALVKVIIDRVCSEREKMILNLVYMEGFNQNEIGVMMEPKICRERVRQLHDSGLRKVRWELLEKGRLLND